MGSIPESGRSPGGGHGNQLQYSCLENPHGLRSLAGYSPWGRRVRYDWCDWACMHAYMTGLKSRLWWPLSGSVMNLAFPASRNMRSKCLFISYNKPYDGFVTAAWMGWDTSSSFSSGFKIGELFESQCYLSILLVNCTSIKLKKVNPNLWESNL